MQPTGEHGAVQQLGCVFCEGNEGALGHIFSEMRIADHSQRGGKDQIDVTMHELGKGGFGALFSVGTQ